MGVLEPDKAREVRIDPALMKLLASDTRRHVLRKLQKRAMTLSELARALELKKATILEHLRRLEDAELITRREDDRLWIYYELTPRARSLVDPVGTRLMIVLGITVFALAVGAIIGLIAQPHLGILGEDDSTDALLVELDENEVSSAGAFALTAILSGASDDTDLQAYLLSGDQVAPLLAGENWVPAAQLEPERLDTTRVHLAGPAHLSPGTYHLFLQQNGNDNRDAMPLVQVRPMQVDLSHTVWWRGLDDDLRVQLPELQQPDGPAWLMVTPPGGDRQPFLVPIEDRQAEIPHEELDRSPQGIHRLHYLHGDDPLIALPGDFNVHEARIQVLPPMILAGDDRQVHILFDADTTARPTTATLQAAGSTLQGESATPSRSVVTLPQVGPGDLHVDVGRLHNETLTVLPDLRVKATLHVGPQLRLNITDAQGEAQSGVQVHLGAEHLGTTGHDGTLIRWSQLPQGDGLLRLVTPDDHTTAWSVTVDDWMIESRHMNLELQDFIAHDFSANVHNLEGWPVTATLVTTLDEDVIGATAITLDANETRRVQVTATEVELMGSRYAMHAETPPLIPVAFQDERTQDESEPDTPPAGGGAGSPPPPAEPESEPLFGVRVATTPSISPPPADPVPVDPEPAEPDPVESVDPDPIDAEPEEEPTPGVGAVVAIVLVATVVVCIRRHGTRRR